MASRSPRLSRPPSSRSRVFTLRLPEALMRRLEEHLDQLEGARVTRAQFLRYLLEKELAKA